MRCSTFDSPARPTLPAIALAAAVALAAGVLSSPAAARQGEDGPDAFTVQVLLDRAGFSPGAIDGEWGRNTEKALQAFQEAHALPVTGSVASHLTR